MKREKQRKGVLLEFQISAGEKIVATSRWLFVFDIHLYVGLVEVQKRDLKKLAA